MHGSSAWMPYGAQGVKGFDGEWPEEGVGVARLNGK